MKGWTGRPVLAMLSVSEIPTVTDPSVLAVLQAGFLAAVDAAPYTAALGGLRAGFLATMKAAPHDVVGERRFAEALLDAQTSPDRDYDYSHQFAVGADAANVLLSQIVGGLA